MLHAQNPMDPKTPNMTNSGFTTPVTNGWIRNTANSIWAMSRLISEYVSLIFSCWSILLRLLYWRRLCAVNVAIDNLRGNSRLVTACTLSLLPHKRCALFTQMEALYEHVQRQFHQSGTWTRPRTRRRSRESGRRRRRRNPLQPLRVDLGRSPE